VESVLLVVTYGVTRRDDLTTSVHQLYQANVQPVGLIVNRVPQRYSSYYYAPYTGLSSSKHDFTAKES
jgi:Mrp family chromosome partitioning ATPase